MAKTPATIPLSTAPANPWLYINWKNTIASCDAAVITPAYCSLKGIDIQNLPEPFSGNIKSNVVCLNLNPGWGESDKCFYGDPSFLKLTQNTLKHKGTDYLWDTPFMCKNGKIHGGYNWWQERTKALRCQLCPKPLDFFVLEFFPYHTKNAFSFPSHLPSNEYRNWLLYQAMKDNKLIVVLRGRDRWFRIKDKCCDGQPLGEKLCDYEKAGRVIIHQNPQSVYLTEKNFKPNDWEKLIAVLKFGNK